jgi:hypothetical protein
LAELGAAGLQPLVFAIAKAMTATIAQAGSTSTRGDTRFLIMVIIKK